MSLLFTIIASLAASVAAYATFRTMLQGMEPALMDGNVLYNPGSQVSRITKLYSRHGTFSIIERDENGKGHLVDSGKAEIPLDIILYSQQKMPVPYQQLFVNGEKRDYYIVCHHDFSRGLSLRNYKAEAIPL